MAFLLLRRTWLFAAKKELVPSAFRGFQESLAYLGIVSCIVSLLLASLVFLCTIYSGNEGAVMLLAALYAVIGFPAWFCIPWSLFLTEVLSFYRPLNNEA